MTQVTAVCGGRPRIARSVCTDAGRTFHDGVGGEVCTFSNPGTAVTAVTSVIRSWNVLPIKAELLRHPAVILPELRHLSEPTIRGAYQLSATCKRIGGT